MIFKCFSLACFIDLDSRVEPFHCAKNNTDSICVLFIAGQLVNISMVAVRLALAFPKKQY